MTVRKARLEGAGGQAGELRIPRSVLHGTLGMSMAIITLQESP
jgi:hypothetical protein